MGLFLINCKNITKSCKNIRFKVSAWGRAEKKSFDDIKIVPRSFSSFSVRFKCKKQKKVMLDKHE